MDKIPCNDTLKELKIKTSNEEGFEKVVLKNDQMLTQLKVIDGHGTWIVLKRQ
jgi:hypothetical protein